MFYDRQTWISVLLITMLLTLIKGPKNHDARLIFMSKHKFGEMPYRNHGNTLQRNELRTLLAI